jgi:hypothetical protein
MHIGREKVELLALQGCCDVIGFFEHRGHLRFQVGLCVCVCDCLADDFRQVIAGVAAV